MCMYGFNINFVVTIILCLHNNARKKVDTEYDEIQVFRDFIGLSCLFSVFCECSLSAQIVALLQQMDTL